MKNSLLLSARCFLHLAFIGGLVTCVHANVTTVAWYRLGENDPGAASGLAVTATTTDLVGVNHLKQFGGPIYTNAASPAGSSLAVQFNGTSQYLSNALVSTAVNNFGIEAWVKPDTTNAGFYAIALNGFTFGGWGMYQSGGNYIASFPFLTDVSIGPASLGTWVHLAFVCDNGTVTTYRNGIAIETITLTPFAAAGGFSVGAYPLGPLSVFNGAIDEVRVFTFTPGQFSTNDLLLDLRSAITLPATGLAGNSATLNGRVNPANVPTSGWFQWGTTTNYGNLTPAQSLGSGTSNTNFSQVIAGLGGGITYHYRAVASNSWGLATGTNQSFTTTIFTDIGAGLAGVADGSAVWGDCDNDGRLDFLITGYGSSSEIAQVWRNTPGGFTLFDAVPGVVVGAARWGDYDNDGRIDFLLTGGYYFFGSQTLSEIWRNIGSGFTNVPINSLAGVESSSVAWGDYDNDGRRDFLLTGRPSSSFTGISQLWRNTGSGFTHVPIAGLPGVSLGSVAWGDYDNDGRLDFLLTGSDLSQIWRNTGNGFSNVTSTVAPGLPGIDGGSVAWGDYDNDGRLDFLLTGLDNTTRVSQIWRNIGGGFSNVTSTVAPGLPGFAQGSAAWGDFDNDGRLDFLLTGGTNIYFTDFLTQLWRNTGSGFTLVNASLPGTLRGSGEWGDYDNDGRLDILLMGLDTNSLRILQVWRNTAALSNTLPTAPTGLAGITSGQGVLLSWNAATDAQTSSSGLHYNVRAGSTPGGTDLIAPQAASTGFRRIPELGNAQMRRTLLLTGLTNGQTVYWSVQAIDTAFAGGPFAVESSFTVTPRLSIAALGGSVTISWSPPSPGWILQESLSLLPATWSNSPSGATNPITVPAAPPTKFYRLFKP